MTPDQLKDLYVQRARVLSRRPELALGSGVTRVVVADDLACDVEQVGRVDLPIAEGGGASAVSPAALMRASIGACLATGYCIWAARLDVPLGSVSVDVACCEDTRGRLELASEIAVGWQQMWVHVTIESAAPEADVRRIVAAADRLSPMLANLSPAVRRLHRLLVVRPGAPATERTVPTEVTPPDVQATKNNV
jgi:uncharacterized OsmC-like protein